MAAYFQLFRKGETEASKFSVVDEELCAYLGTPVDDNEYVLSWYDVIGFRLALGHSFCRIISDLGEAHDKYKTQSSLLRFLCATYLANNYSCEAWFGR